MKKKLTLLFVALLAMTAFAGVWHAANRAPEVAQEWDFTQAFSADDLSNLMADPGNWNDENANQTRFGNATAIENAQLKAKEKVIEWTKGLVFVKFAANNKVRLNPGKSLGLNGNNLSIQIPVQKGDKVTVKWQTAKSSEGSRYLSADNLDVITGFKDPASNEIQTSDGTAKEAGYVTITTTGGGINIFSIKVESAEEPNPDPQPGGETTTDPYFQKITSTADLTLGEYLIVNEDAGIAFNGGLETLDAVDDVIAVGVDNGKIVSSQASEEAKFTLEAGGYFKSNSGFYIGLNNSSNGLKQSADFNEVWKHTITFDDQGNAVIIISGSDWSKHLRYNKNNGQNRFRYYNEGAQQPVQLYKKIFPAAEPTSTTVDKLYIIGDINGWDLTNMSEMTWNSESNAFEFEINVSSEQNFAISDVASLEKDDWDGFKASHRYTLEGGGKYDNIAGQYAQLVQVHGDECINVPSGKYLIRVTKDLQIAMFLQGPYEESDATIEKVVLLGSFNGWNQEADGMQKQDGANTWTATLDGRGISENIEFKLLVNGGSWLGVNEMEIDAPAPWYGSGEYGNIALYHPTTGYDTYTITAVWTPNSNAASGWKLTIAGKDARKTDVAVEVKEGEDIAAAAQAAAEQTNANVTLNLTEGATYELSQPLVVNNNNNLIINGNGATINASGNNGALIQYSAPAAAPRRAPATPADGWTYIDNVTIKDVTITGIKGSIFYDNNEKICVDNFTIDNAVLSLATEAVDNEALISFKAGGIKDFTIKNSTVYGNNAVAKYFIRYSNNGRIDRYGYGADDTWSMTYTNNTFYGLLKEDGQWGNYSGVAGKAGQMIMTIKDNIWYNCDASTMRRLNQSKNFSNFNAKSTMSNNTFWRNGGAVDQEGYGNGSDITTEPIFKDPATGDFTLGACEQAEKETGDPRWTGTYDVLWSSATPVAVGWGQPAAVLPADQTGVIEVGDVLHLSISDVPAGATQWNWQAQARIEDGSWTDLGFGQALAEGQTEVTFVISGILAQIIHEKGMQIRGTGFSANKLVLEKGVYSGSENSIWVGRQALTWTQVTVGGALFQTAGAEVGKALEIYFDRGEAVPNVQLRTSWNDGDQFYGSMYDGPSPLRIPLTEELANKLKSNQLIINANDITVTSVELSPYTDVAAATKKANQEEFVINSEAVVIAKEKKGNHVYVYIKDDSGNTLIYDNDGSKTADLEVGKTIKRDWKGQVSIYNGLFEIVPQEVLAVTAADAQEIDYPTASTLKVFKASNVNKIYKVTNVTLSEINGSNFKVKRGVLEVAGYNQFDGVSIEDGLVCDEVIAAVGIYNDQVQLQPIKITATFEPVAVNMNAGGDITEAIAAAKAGKNPSTLTINLAEADYTVSAPIIANGDVIINGNGANIDASALTGPMIKMSTYPSVAGTDVDGVTAYQVGNVELNEINVDNLSQNLFDCNKTNYLFENVTLNKSIIAIKGASNKTIFNFNGGGNTKNLTVSGSTLYADDATTWSNGGFFSTQSSKSVLQLGGTEEKTTIENSTFYNIAKGKTVSTLVKNSQAWMTYEVKSCLIVNSGKSGQFLAGLNAGQKGANSNWIVDNCSFTYDGQDVAATEATKIKDNVMTNTVYGVPFFRKNIEEGDFTLGVCPQIGKNVGDPRWYNIPMITKLQEALDKAAALLDVAQADWQTAPAANEAIEMLAGAYNENVPYLDSNSQEEVDDATLRVEAAIAEFEKVYGSNPTAIKSVDAVKADGDAWYTINGQRISTPTEKGIYIHNGKKVVVK